MNDYLQRVNSAPFYGIVAGVLGFITIMCFVFLMKSYRAGLRILFRDALTQGIFKGIVAHRLHIEMHQAEDHLGKYYG